MEALEDAEKMGAEGSELAREMRDRVRRAKAWEERADAMLAAEQEGDEGAGPRLPTVDELTVRRRLLGGCADGHSVDETSRAR